MQVTNFSTQDWLLFAANGSMLACCIFYICWWLNANKSGAYHPNSPALLFLTIAFGLVAVGLFIFGVSKSSAAFVPTWCICVGSLALYILLFIISDKVFKRPTTSELLIMIVWLMGELCALNVLYDERLNVAKSLVLLVLIFAEFVAGYICYLKYYKLAGSAMVIDGTIPLAADGAVVLIFMILQMI